MSVKLRKRKQGNGKTHLYLDIYSQGKRTYEHLGLYLTQDRTHNKETLALGQSIAAKRQLELQSNPHGYVPDFKRDIDFVQYFQTLTLARHKSWKSTLYHLRDFQPSPLPFRLLDEKWLEAFTSYLLNKVGPNTASTYYNKIKAALKIALKEKLITENPSRHATGPKSAPTHRTFLAAEDMKLLANTTCSNQEVRRAFFFACYTGLRLSDVRALTWANVQGSQLHFRQKKTGGAEYLPLSAMAASLMGTTEGPDAPVFKLPKGDWTVWDVLQKWGKEAKLGKEISFHVSRHTFATLALTSGVDIYTVSKLLGHTDIKNTQIYAKIIDERKNQAVNLLPQMDL